MKLILCAAAVAVATSATNGTCDVYKQKSTNCASDCGSCFNPGARPGVLSKGQQTGYYCPGDGATETQDTTFACMDWTFGSAAMRAAEMAFAQRTNDAVYFGVGTFGTSDDPQRGLGACYRLRVDGVDKDILAQSVNTGSDVAGNQFDLQIGAGGAGAFNTCAGSTSSMYPGSTAAWGKQYGGVDNRTACQGLPQYPAVAGPMQAAGDDLRVLCEYGFDKNVRLEGGGNPSLLDVARVRCPSELVTFTQIQRTDEPTSYALADGVDRQQAEHQCQADQPGGTTAWCLTRMMDCRKPSGAFKDNVKSSVVAAGQRLVQTCTKDGYTRIDVQCGCADCYC